MISVICPECRNSLQAPTEYAGREVKCGICEAKVRLPQKLRPKKRDSSLVSFWRNSSTTKNIRIATLFALLFVGYQLLIIKKELATIPRFGDVVMEEYKLERRPEKGFADSEWNAPIITVKRVIEEVDVDVDNTVNVRGSVDVDNTVDVRGNVDVDNTVDVKIQP